MNTLKRKRRLTVSSVPRGFRPNTLSPPPLGTLVDYDEDDDDLGVVGPDLAPARTPAPAPSPHKAFISHSRDMAISARMTHRQTLSSAPPKRPSAIDDQDNLIWSKTAHLSNPPVVMLPEIGPMRPSGKRRREDDEDGLLERLSKTKKVDLGGQKDGPGRIGAVKVGDDPPKKMKLKFGATSLAVASPSPSNPPTEPGVKDGDTG